MKRSKLLVHFSTFLFYLLCICGCLWQLISLSLIYFEFKTSTEVYVNIPMEVANPALSICFRYKDIIDKKKIKQKVKTSLEKPIDSDINRNWENYMTVRDVFAQTPTTEWLIKSCRLREPHTYTYRDLTMLQCQETFHVSKYYFLEYACYRFRTRVKSRDLYNYLKISYASELSGMMFEVTFNLTVFRLAEGLRLVVHSPDSLPFLSMTMTPVVWRLFDKRSRTAHYNRFNMIYSTVEITSLPSPYHTNCLSRSQAVCKKNCVTNATLEAFGKFPFEFAIDWPVDRGFITNADVKNKSLSDTLLQFKSTCDSLCVQLPCFVDYTLTRVTRLQERQQMDFRVSAPREPSTAIIHNPFLTTSSYVIGFSSVLGTWLGFSILKINPFKLWTYHPEKSLLHKNKSTTVCDYCFKTRRQLMQQIVLRYRLVNRP